MTEAKHAILVVDDDDIDRAALRELRLILVSSHDDPAMHELAERVKADAFVSKRDLHEQLVATVRRVLLR